MLGKNKISIVLIVMISLTIVPTVVFGGQAEVALMKAIQEGKIDIATSILDQFSPNLDHPVEYHWGTTAVWGKQNVRIMTPLIFACSQRQWEIAKLLVDRGASPNQKNSHGAFGTLYEAVSSGNLEMAKYFIDKGVDVNSKYTETYQAFSNYKDQKEFGLADYKWNSDAPYSLWKLLLANKLDVSQPGLLADMLTHGRNMRNGQKSQVKTVKLMLDHGAGVNSVTSTKYSGKRTPLHVAIYTGKYDVAVLLMQHGANVNATRKNGDTPFHVLCRKNRVKRMKDKKGENTLLTCAKQMIEKGADLNLTTKNGKTPLELAIETRNDPLKVLLRESGAPDTPNTIGR